MPCKRTPVKADPKRGGGTYPTRSKGPVPSALGPNTTSNSSTASNRSNAANKSEIIVPNIVKPRATQETNGPKGIRGGQKATAQPPDRGAPRPEVDANKTMISDSHTSDRETPEKQGALPLQTPPTVVRGKENTSKATLAQKAAASGLENASRILHNRANNITQRSIVGSHHTEQRETTTEDRQDHSTSLNFDPLLQSINYSQVQRDLFRMSRLQPTHNISISRSEQRSESVNIVRHIDAQELAQVETEALTTAHDSVTKIRTSLKALAHHVEGLQGNCAVEKKQELMEVQQDLIRRITDHCLLRGHLFLAEGKHHQGELLLEIDRQLKAAALEVLAKIALLEDKERASCLQHSEPRLDNPTIGTQQPIPGPSRHNSLKHTAIAPSGPSSKPSKNEFKSHKSSSRAAAVREQDRFHQELNKRSINNARLESTRDEEKIRSKIDRSRLDEYLEQASKTRMRLPSCAPEVEMPQRRVSTPARKHRLVSEPDRGGSYLYRNASPPRYQSPKIKLKVTEGGYHGQEAEDPDFYGFLPAPWNKQPCQSTQTFNNLLSLQKNGVLPTFDGQQSNYQNFRSLFIMMVHSTHIGIFAKDVLMRHALRACSALSTLMAAAPPGPQGYAMIINRLEERYGGSTKLLNHYLTRIKRVAPIQEGQVDSLEELLDNANGYHAALATWGARDATTHSHYNLLLNKFGPVLRMRYHSYMAEHPGGSDHDVEHLLHWAQMFLLKPWRMEPLAFKKPQERKQEHRQGQQPLRQPQDRPVAVDINKFRQQVPPGRHYQAQAQQKTGCPQCKAEHNLAQCKQFSKLEPEGRMEVVMKAAACFRCLSIGHRSRTCRVSNPCNKCKRKHHTLLHEFLAASDKPSDMRGAEVQMKAFPAQESEEDRKQELLQNKTLEPDQIPEPQALPGIAEMLPDEHRINFFRCYQLESPSEIISLRFAVVTIVNVDNNKEFTIGALLDDGANMTILSERLATRLELKGDRRQMGVLGVGGNLQQHKSLESIVRLKSLNGQLAKNIVVRTLQDPTGGLEVTRWKEHQNNWSHLQGLQLPNIPKGLKVDIIIGNDQTYFHRSLKEVTHPQDVDAPVARLTPLGWTVAGRLAPIKQTSTPRVNKMVATIFKSRVIPSGWERIVQPGQFGLSPMEGQDRPPIVNPGDRKALRTLQELSCSKDNKVKAPVLWAGQDRPPNNLQDAMEHWNSSRKSLLRKPEVYKQYAEQIQGWLDKGYVKQIPKEKLNEAEAYYLPHFPVVRMDHSTTKVRIVMDGKASFNNKKSLNDCILKGPKLLNELTVVVTNFRKHRVAVAGDVKEMFLQIGLFPEDSKFHRFIFTFPHEDLYIVLESIVHVFGNRGSPVVVIFIIKWTAYKMRKECPLAAAVILDGSIVDDCMGSVPTVEQAQELIKQLIKVFKACGMTIHKWASSHARVLPSLNQEERVLKEFDESTPDGKALGLVWNPRSDTFKFKMSTEKPTIWTRRSALKYYMTLFDPLGMILPFIMQARFLFKDTWASTDGWEEPTSKRVSKLWDKWQEDTRLLPAISIPRWIRLEFAVELHVFGDASYNAYGIAMYVVAKENEVATSTLVYSKARTVTSSAKTIPRAEMTAAVMAAKVAVKWSAELGIALANTHCHSDSENALAWIKAPRRDLNQLSARQSAQIRELISPFNWHYVPTKLNPADLVTRGLDPQRLAACTLWWQGPEYLITGDKPHDKIIPRAHEDLPNEEELRRLVGIFHGRVATRTDPGDIYRQSNCWHKTVRVLDKVAEAIYTCSKGRVDVGDGLSVWVRWEQNRTHSAEKELVDRGLRPKGQIWQQYDLKVSRGVLLVGGRTNRNMKPILHKDSDLVKKWLLYLHQKVLRHAGGWKVLLGESREHFWCFNAASTVKLAIRNCINCKRLNPPNQSQRMAPLPSVRLANQTRRAFEHIAIDFAGPWYVRIGPGQARQPRYILIICCMTFRAIRHEIVPNRETATVLIALQNFSNRDRIPSTIRSDNGAELVRAAEELRRLNMGIQGCSPMVPAWSNVKWSFSHPAAPHTNGVVESLVGVMKRSLTRVLGSQSLTEFTFRSAATFAENVANMRPMGLISNDPNDPKPLTPGMFIGQFPLPGEVELAAAKPNKYIKNWQQLNTLKDQFYDRFQKEIVPELDKRDKWWDLLDPLVEDQVVICLQCEPTVDGRWPLGRVVKVFYNPDKSVKAATVFVNGKLLKRNIRHLIPLL